MEPVESPPISTESPPPSPAPARRRGRTMAKRVLVAAVYVGSIVAANWLTHRYGQVHIGFGLLVTAGTFAAGAALLSRNFGQDLLGRPLIIGLMVVGVALSWWLASAQLAEASAAAFALSETTDMTVYTWLRRRGRPKALLVAALLSALVDTAVFLKIAKYPLTVDAVTGQMLVKVGISGLVALGLEVRHQVLRKSDRPRRAGSDEGRAAGIH